MLAVLGARHTYMMHSAVRQPFLKSITRVLNSLTCLERGVSSSGLANHIDFVQLANDRLRYRYARTLCQGLSCRYER